MSQQVTVDAFAPNWAHNLVNQINLALGDQTWPFISRSTFTTAALNATFAAQYPGKLALVSNGNGNRWIARSNGSAFYYADGTAV